MRVKQVVTTLETECKIPRLLSRHQKVAESEKSNIMPQKSTSKFSGITIWSPEVPEISQFAFNMEIVNGLGKVINSFLLSCFFCNVK